MFYVQVFSSSQADPQDLATGSLQGGLLPVYLLYLVMQGFLKGNCCCSPFENKYFLIGFKWDFGLNWL